MKEEKEKLSDTEIDVSKNKFLKWLDNFWYHYKWQTIAVLVVLALLIGLLSTCTGKGRTNANISVVFAGSYSMNATQKTSLETALSLLVKKEGKDGETVTVGVPDYPIFTDEEARAMATDENGNFSLTYYESLRQQCVKNMTTFGDYVMTGECAIYLVNESVYKAQNLSKLAAPLAESLGATPEGAYDEYAIRIGDTAFYQYYEAIQFLPSDTLLVLTQPYIFGSTSNKEYYGQSKAVYLAIHAFTPSVTNTPSVATTTALTTTVTTEKKDESTEDPTT